MPRKRKRSRGQGHRPHGRGSLEMDVTVHGIHIRRATGTTDPDVFALYRGMVKQLAAAGRIDILRQLTEKRGRRYVLSFAEVWDVMRPHSDRPVNLNRLPSPLTMRKLWSDDAADPGAFEAWAESRPGALDRKNKRRDVRQLRRMGATFQTIADLPSVLETYREYCETTGKHRAFNMARNTVQAFLRDTVKRSHPLYGSILDIETLPETKKPGRPLLPAEIPAFLEKVRAAAGEAYADAFQGMLLTGMRLAEFWGAWELKPDHVHIRSAKQKRGPAVWRVVPRVGPLVPPPMSQQSFEDRWAEKKLSEFHTPYDGRRTFARACEEAGIPMSRLKAYLGHGIASITDLYLRHEVLPYLAEDGAKLRAYFGLRDDGSPGLRLVEGA